MQNALRLSSVAAGINAAATAAADDDEEIARRIPRNTTHPPTGVWLALARSHIQLLNIADNVSY